MTTILTPNNDQFVATAGDDTIQGLTGNDNINGGAGDDKIDAGGGNDNINGGSGSDRMKGGAGNDTFFFHKGEVGGGAGMEHIVDFQGAGGFNAVQDFIRFVGFGDGSTFTFASVATGHTNAAIYNLYDAADDSTVQILLQFADAAGLNTAATTLLGGAKGGVAPTGSDFGWL